VVKVGYRQLAPPLDLEQHVMQNAEAYRMNTDPGGPDTMSVQSALSAPPGRLPEGKTSIFWAIFLVVNAALGAGLLAIPLSFYMTGGILSGILIELVRTEHVRKVH
jgi:hypothetical protein